MLFIEPVQALVHKPGAGGELAALGGLRQLSQNPLDKIVEVSPAIALGDHVEGDIDRILQFLNRLIEVDDLVRLQSSRKFENRLSFQPLLGCPRRRSALVQDRDELVDLVLNPAMPVSNVGEPVLNRF